MLITHGKLVIEVVGEQWVGQLPEVGLAEGADAVDVLQVQILVEVRTGFIVKLTPGGHRY